VALKVAELFRRKDWQEPAADDGAQPTLRRTLGAFDLTLLGVGAIVGAGIFPASARWRRAAPTIPRRAGADPVVRDHRGRLWVLGAVLRRDRGDGARVGQRLHLRLRRAGRAAGLDHRLGSDHRVRVGNIYVAQSWADYFRSFLRGSLGVDFPAWMATDLQTVAHDPALAALAPSWRRRSERSRWLQSAGGR